MIITVIIIWTPTQKPIKHVASGKSKTDLSKSWLVSNVVVFSTSDHQIRIIFSSCPVNGLLPVSFLTGKNVWGLSLSNYKYQLLQQRSLFLSFNTLSLLCLCLFFLSSPTICRRNRRRRRDSLSVIYSLQRFSWSSLFGSLLFCVDVKKKHFFKGF